MADLLDRVLGLLDASESHRALPYTALLAAMREVQRGELTPAQVYAALELPPSEQTSLNTVYNQIYVAGTLPEDEFVDLMVLGATRDRENPAGQPYYDKATVLTRLGL